MYDSRFVCWSRAFTLKVDRLGPVRWEWFDRQRERGKGRGIEKEQKGRGLEKAPSSNDFESRILLSRRVNKMREKLLTSINSGLTFSSNSSGVKSPSSTVASLRVLPSWWAFLAHLATSRSKSKKKRSKSQSQSERKLERWVSTTHCRNPNDCSR